MQSSPTRFSGASCISSTGSAHISSPVNSGFAECSRKHEQQTTAAQFPEARMANMIGGRFTVGPRLGAGMQAEVRAGIDTTTDTPVALKIIDRGQLKRRALDALEREVRNRHRKFFMVS
jgi:hypothetical protein